MAWLIVLVVAWALWRLRGATVYFSHPFGYRAVSMSHGKDEKLQPVPRDRYERILQRFVQGALFDELWVSLLQDPYGGVVLGNEGVETEMSLSFRSLMEPERLVAFREGMASSGYIPVMEHPWNVGLGQDMEMWRLEYRLPTDLDAISKAVDHALEILQGDAGEIVFVHAWRSQDGPRRRGITIRAPHDVPAQVP